MYIDIFETRITFSDGGDRSVGIDPWRYELVSYGPMDRDEAEAVADALSECGQCMKSSIVSVSVVIHCHSCKQIFEVKPEWDEEGDYCRTLWNKEGRLDFACPKCGMRFVDE